MERWCDKVAIVTGASVGIGKAIAESLTKAGMQVVGFSRRFELVEANAKKLASCKGKLHAVKCDMMVEEDILQAFEWTTKHVGPVHVLINNAGILEPTNLIAGDTQSWRDSLNTNVLGLCIATREAIKVMTAHNICGHIIHNNSISGHSHLYFPTLNVYGASKHAVTNLTETLRQELLLDNKSNIKVTSISPGVVRTDMTKDVFPKDMPMLQSQDVADTVLFTLGLPQRVQINEIILRATAATL